MIDHSLGERKKKNYYNGNAILEISYIHLDSDIAQHIFQHMFIVFFF